MNIDNVSELNINNVFQLNIDIVSQCGTQLLTMPPSVAHNYNAVLSVPLSDTIDASIGAGNGNVRAPSERSVVSHIRNFNV